MSYISGTYCEECKKDDPDLIINDHGIGSYDYFGTIYIDKNLIVETICCNASAIFKESKDTVDVYDL